MVKLGERRLELENVERRRELTLVSARDARVKGRQEWLTSKTLASGMHYI